MNNGIPSGALIGQYMIRSERLRELTNSVFRGSDSNELDIYIDASSILSQLYTEAFNTSAMLHPNEIAAGLINLITHYRNFYWNYYKVVTTFHVVWSTNCPKVAQLFYSNYNTSYTAAAKYSSEKIDIILENMKILAEVIQYIPDCSLTLGTFETGVIMTYIMRNINNSHPNIIITKDLMTMQACCHNLDTVVFRPQKKDGEDLSIFITNNGMIEFLCDKRKVIKPDTVSFISPKLIGMILAMTRVPERGIKALIQLPLAIQALDAAICKGDLLNNYNSNAITVSQALDNKVSTRLLSNSIAERFKAIDLEYQLICFNNNPERLNFVGCMNKSNPQKLHSLIDKYFNGIEVKL